MLRRYGFLTTLIAALAGCGGEEETTPIEAPPATFGLNDAGPFCDAPDFVGSSEVVGVERVPVPEPALTRYHSCIWECSEGRAQYVQMVWVDDGSGWKPLAHRPLVIGCR